MELKAKMPGKIEEIKVNVGDAINKGDVVLIMEAMKMKNPMPSPEAGSVKEIKVATGDRVNAGDVLVVIE
jgi:biotin carboxyl carrier protein